MQKIPVLETAGQTYGFAFGRYFSVLGIVWLPLLIFAVAAYFALAPFFIHLGQAMAHPTDTAGFAKDMAGLNGRIWAMDLGEILLFAVIGVGITREAFGRRNPLKFVYLRFGADELRVVGGYLLLLAIFIGSMIVVMIGGAILAAISAGAFSASGHAGGITALQGGGLGGLFIFLVFVAMFYIFARLAYLLVPVTVAEQRIGLWRSWELTQGNVLRILGVLIATLLPFFVAMLVIESVTILPVVFKVASQAQQHQNQAEAFAAAWKTILGYLPYYAVAMFVLMPIVYGLMMGSPAFAYRALVPDAPSAPPSA